MAKVEIDQELCKECRYCIIKCPQGILSTSEKTNSSGYHFTVQVQAEKCTACGICYLMCPDAAVTVYR